MLCLSLLTLPLAAANLIPDGAFDRMPSPWTIGGGGIDFAAGDGRGGTRCLRIDARAGGPEANAVSEPFAVDPKARYRLAASVRLLEPASRGFKVTIDWLTADGAHIAYANDWAGNAARGEWQSHGGVYQPPPGAAGARILLGVQAGGLMLFDDCSLTILEPAFRIEGLGAQSAVLTVGRPARVRCRIVNDGGSPLAGLRGTLGLLGAGVPVSVEFLPVGGEAVVEADITPTAPGPVVLEARLACDGLPPDMQRRTQIASPAEPEPGPALRAGALELRWQALGAGHAAGVLWWRDRPRAVIPAPAWLTLDTDPPQPVLARFEAAGNGLVGRWEGAAAAVELRLEPAGEGGLEYRCELRAKRDLALRNFTGPDLHLPGSEKDSALFCGLEYLTAEESSSQAPALNPMQMPRWVPHPNRITRPLMAIARDGAAVCLEWAPRQEYAPGDDRPSAFFGCPNRLDQEDGHAMALFVPSVPTYVDENQRSASRPLPVPAGGRVRLVARLSVREVHRDVSEALPQAAIASHADRDIATLWQPAAAGRLNGFDEAVAGWKPEAHREAGFHPDIALRLWNYAVWHDDDLAARARGQVLAAVAALGGEKGRLGLDLALHLGGVQQNLGGLRGGAPHLDTQRTDGSWPFVPDDRTAILGEAGDTDVGTVARPLLGVLQAVRRNGDPSAWAAAQRGLAYLNARHSRPAGGETWEVPLHDPNLMAAALATECNVAAYELSSDQAYLDAAAYWARTGLAFVYDWQAADRPGMLGATTSVFGTTFYTHPWYGRPVQWVGLVYASSLLRLAPYADGPRQRAVAGEILASAVEQQSMAAEADSGNPLPGFFPDVYDLIDGVVKPAWIGPQLLCQVAEQAAGREPSRLQLLGPPAAQLRLLTATADAIARLDGDRLAVSLRYRRGQAFHTVLTCVTRPSRVTWNDRPLPESADLDASDEGWWHADRVLIIKHLSTGTDLLELAGLRFAGPA